MRDRIGRSSRGRRPTASSWAPSMPSAPASSARTPASSPTGSASCPTFSIYDDADQIETVKQAMTAVGIDPKTYQPRRMLSRISAAKSALFVPDEARNAGRDLRRRGHRPRLHRVRAPPATGQRRRLRRSPRAYRSASSRPRRVSWSAIRSASATSWSTSTRTPTASSTSSSPPSPTTPQPLRRRRPRSVDLRLAPGRHSQHPRLRTRLSRRPPDPPRTQLPLDPPHRRRRRPRHPRQHPRSTAASAPRIDDGEPMQSAELADQDHEANSSSSRSAAWPISMVLPTTTSP